MRRITMLVVLALFATATFAQVQPRMGVANLQKNKVGMAQGTKSSLKFANLISANSASATMKAPKKADIITDQPDGTLLDNLYRMGDSYYVFSGYLVAQHVDGAIGTLVEGSDGNLYMKSPFSQFPSTGWLTAEKGTGDTVVVKCPQPVYEQDGTIYYADKMVLTTLDDGSQTYVCDSLDNNMKFVWKDGNLTQYTEGVVGLTNEAKQWTGYADYNMQFNKMTDEPVVADLGSATPEDYALIYHPTDTTLLGRIVSVAINGNTVYAKNLIDALPDSWIKGTIDGDKCTFLTKQYLGKDEIQGDHAYFMAGASKKVYDSYYNQIVDSFYFSNKIVFDYDATAKTLKSDSAMFANIGCNNLNAYTTFNRPEFKPYKDVAATPKDPEIIIFSDYDAQAGSGLILFNIFTMDKDGEFINPAKLYYNMYLDDEVMTLEPDEYTTLTEPMTDIPYDYSNGVDVKCSDAIHLLMFYSTGFDKMGIQAVYKGGNEVRKSNIVYYVITGINNATASTAKNVKSVTYTDISGRKVSNPVRGLYIKTETYTDGTTNNSKVLVK
jgi:hypothetical protein